jgi:hypothetical protein
VLFKVTSPSLAGVARADGARAPLNGSTHNEMIAHGVPCDNGCNAVTSAQDSATGVSLLNSECILVDAT